MTNIFSAIFVTMWFSKVVLSQDYAEVKTNFMDAFEHCKAEVQLTDELMGELMNFWDKEFQFERREFGCVLECLGKYFNLFTGNKRMHHGSMDEFLNFSPKAGSLAETLIKTIHECEQKYDHEMDHCWRLLRIAECFKHSAVKKGFAPDVELMMIEIILEGDDE